MVDIYITSDEIKKYIFMIVLFNAIFPKVLEQSGMMVNIEDAEDPTNIRRMAYENFIDRYDLYGLNQISSRFLSLLVIISFPASTVYSTKSVSGLTLSSSRIVLLTVNAHPLPFLINFLYISQPYNTYI